MLSITHKNNNKPTKVHLRYNKKRFRKFPKRKMTVLVGVYYEQVDLI